MKENQYVGKDSTMTRHGCASEDIFFHNVDGFDMMSVGVKIVRLSLITDGCLAGDEINHFFPKERWHFPFLYEETRVIPRFLLHKDRYSVLLHVAHKKYSLIHTYGIHWV